MNNKDAPLNQILIGDLVLKLVISAFIPFLYLCFTSGGLISLILKKKMQYSLKRSISVFVFFFALFQILLSLLCYIIFLISKKELYLRTLLPSAFFYILFSFIAFVYVYFSGDFKNVFGIKHLLFYEKLLHKIRFSSRENYLVENKMFVESIKSSPKLNLGKKLDFINGDLNLELEWKDINHHIHILGQSGAGKSVLLQNLYTYNILQGNGFLFLDLKADVDIKRDFTSLAALSDRTEDLMIIDLSNPKESFGYNPLLIGNATELKDKIIGSIEWSESYYKKTSEKYLLTLLRGFVWLRDNKSSIPILEDLLLSISSTQAMIHLADKIDDSEIKNDIITLVKEQGKDWAKDLNGLRADLFMLVKSEFGEIFKRKDQIDIRWAVQNKKIVLVNLDGQTYNESAKRIGRLLISDLRATSGYIVSNIPKADRPKFSVVIDEAADIISTEDMAKTFAGFLNRCRGSGIGVVIAHQSLGDFKEDSTRKQIMDSTETLISFVQKDPDSCEILSSVIGTQETKEITSQVEDSTFTHVATGKGTMKTVHEYIYNPNEFRNLPTGVAIYAAKKPTRYAKIKVNFLKIPQIETEILKPKQNEILKGIFSELNSKKSKIGNELREQIEF